MLVNEEGKLFGVINIVDVFVICVALVVMLGLYFKFIHPREKIVTKPEVIEYVIRVKGIREPSVKALMNGGEIVNSKTKESLGTIVDVKSSSFYSEAAPLDGIVQVFEVPGEYTAEVTVRVNGKSNDRGYYTDKNKDITVGSMSNFSSKYVMTSGDIISITTVESTSP